MFNRTCASVSGPISQPGMGLCFCRDNWSGQAELGVSDGERRRRRCTRSARCLLLAADQASEQQRSLVPLTDAMLPALETLLWRRGGCSAWVAPSACDSDV